VCFSLLPKALSGARPPQSASGIRIGGQKKAKKRLAELGAAGYLLGRQFSLFEA
jgi:hypothetical protein